MASGKEAAVSIARYCDGQDMADGRVALAKDDPIYRPVPSTAAKKARAAMQELPVADRQGNFNEVELGLKPEDYKRVDFDLLEHLGFSKAEIEEANNVICGMMTIEGAPHLRFCALSGEGISLLPFQYRSSSSTRRPPSGCKSGSRCTKPRLPIGKRRAPQPARPPPGSPVSRFEFASLVHIARLLPSLQQLLELIERLRSGLLGLLLCDSLLFLFF